MNEPNLLVDWDRSRPYLLISHHGRDTQPMVHRALCGWTAVLGPCLAEVARRLGIYPQTPQHRMEQIERIFGGSPRDPRNRFGLELALRGNWLLAGDNGAGPAV
ncbi:helix-turn-helix domain-containing protein [Streptomyces sp. NPDC058989]|uniref:helix-turn-helix domain-containing protein n=1 Tax=Streptomyces sp. NPDC058989 TaxID=3346686 RepID=UPI0036902BDD